MRMKMFFIGIALILVLTVSAVAADIAGTWIAERQGPQGVVQTTFNFTVNGDTLTGTVSRGGRMGDAEITEGKIEGDEISFFVVQQFGDNEMKVLHKGKIKGDEIKFTMERPNVPRGGGMGAPGGGPGGGRGAGAGMGAPKPDGGPGAGGMGGPGGGQRGPQELVARRVQ